MVRMPVLFVGHGSPMNAIEDNRHTRGWATIAARIPRPSAILAISAHWTTPSVRTTDSLRPKVVYDMYGFPEELYQVHYQPPGDPALAHQLQTMLAGCQIDNSWGIDHGTWSVLTHMYPQADIPVVQISLDRQAARIFHFQAGQALKPLRDQGILILGSGNVVHNLARINWNMADGYPWAVEFDQYIQDRIIAREYPQVVDYRSAGYSAELAIPTTEHFDPLLYVLGATDPQDQVEIFNSACLMGSLSMTSYLFQ